jgi:hypothetical protein
MDPAETAVAEPVSRGREQLMDSSSVAADTRPSPSLFPVAASSSVGLAALGRDDAGEHLLQVRERVEAAAQ